MVRARSRGGGASGCLEEQGPVKQSGLMTGDPDVSKNIQSKRSVFISSVLPGQYLKEEK